MIQAWHRMAAGKRRGRSPTLWQAGLSHSRTLRVSSSSLGGSVCASVGATVGAQPCAKHVVVLSHVVRVRDHLPHMVMAASGP